MTFVTNSRKKKTRYAIASVCFIAFTLLWAILPFLGEKTSLSGGNRAFIARAVDLRSIRVNDLQGASAPGVPIVLGSEGSQKMQIQQSQDVTGKSSSKRGSGMLGGHIFGKDLKNLQNASLAKGEKNRYTPDAKKAQEKKENKGYVSNEEDEGSEQITPSSASAGAGGAFSGTTAKVREFFGTQVADAEIAKGNVEDFDVEQGESVSLNQLKFSQGQSQVGMTKKIPEGAKDAASAAFENLAKKDIKSAENVFKRGKTEEFLDSENKFASSSLGGGTAVSTRTIGFSGVEQNKEQTEDEKEDEREYWEEMFAEGNLQGGSGIGGLLLQFGLMWLLSVLKIGPPW